MEEIKAKKKPLRKPFFRFVKKILKLFIRKPKVLNANEDGLDENAIYITNHVGASAPLRMELYFPHEFKFWGTYEMVFTYRERWTYLRTTYFHQKKHNNKFVANIKGTLALPFLSGFYRGMQLIPTYPDNRMLKTIKNSTEFLNQGHSIIIFPENSSDGYHDVLTHYFAGFIMLAKSYYKKYGKNVKIYNMYYRKKDNTLLIDKYTTIEEILKDERDMRVIANDFRDRANSLVNINEVKDFDLSIEELNKRAEENKEN